MTLAGDGGAGVGDLGNEIAEVTAIAYGAFHALIGQQAADQQLSDTEIAQHIIDVSGDEDG